MSCRLSDIATYVNERVSISKLTLKTYVSTENMIPNKGGITVSSGLPAISTTQAFKQGDVLVSNIRPYFKKIWVAEYDGGCSNDVLVFRPKEEIVSSEFLYLVLSDDAFFDYMMAGSKGTKMPRGDRKAIIDYLISDFAISHQDQITRILLPLNRKIHVNAKLNDNLAKQAMILYEQMLGTNPLTKYRLCDIASITMGQSPVGSSYNEEGIGTVFYQGRTDFGFRFPTRRLYTTAPKKMAAKGDVLLSVRAPVGDINMANESCCIGRGLSCLRSLHNTPSFLYYTMASIKPILDQFNGEGTVFGSVSQDSLNNLSIQIPSSEQINSFENKVAPIDAMIMNNNEEILRLTALRDYLLPRLLSGQLSIGN